MTAEFITGELSSVKATAPFSTRQASRQAPQPGVTMVSSVRQCRVPAVHNFAGDLPPGRACSMLMRRQIHSPLGKAMPCELDHHSPLGKVIPWALQGKVARSCSGRRSSVGCSGTAIRSGSPRQWVNRS
jgi:hypothetical protein